MATSISKSILKHKFQSTDGELALIDCQGQKVVLYFYPKDNTSGCTQESKDFRDHLKQFEKLNARIIGVSRDSLKSHDKFIQNHDLNFTLISDPDETLCNALDVMKEKSMYGRKYMGIERSTFILDENGKVAHEWRNVKVPGHVVEVLETLGTL